jgi:hypothetical protein
MEQNFPLHAIDQQAQAFALSVVTAKKATDELAVYCHSIKHCIDEAAGGHRGPVEKKKTEEFVRRLEQIDRTALEIRSCTKNLSSTIKLAYCNAQWAHRAATQYALSHGSVPSVAPIGKSLQKASDYIMNMNSIERLVSNTDVHSIEQVAFRLRYIMHYVSKVIFSTKILENSLYGAPAKEFAQTAQQFFTRAFKDEKTIESNACNILWLITLAKSHAPDSSPVQNIEQKTGNIVEAAQALHV